MNKNSFFCVITLSLVFIFPPHLIAADCNQAEILFKKAKELKDDLSGLVTKEQLYKKAIELCPSYAPAHNNLGDVYEKMGRYEEAIAQYKKTNQIKPDAPEPYFGLGDIYYKTNRPKEAVFWYEKGLHYDPSDKLARERLSFAKDLVQGGLIRAGTIRGMLSGTRGAGEIVPITFGEGLIPFDYNKSNIRPDARPQLNEIGQALKWILMNSKDVAVEAVDKEAPVIEIAGHTDIRGSDEYNLKLSRDRAESVVNYLVTHFNLSKERLRPQGYGKRVPLCQAETTEGCHALNRRVEIIKGTEKIITEGGRTRNVSTNNPSFRGGNEPKLILDTGFFYMKKGEKQVKILKEDSTLRSKEDKYFFFFRPYQDCYVYIFQEDSQKKIDLLFPQKDKDAQVKKGADYWVPEFGKTFALDETKGKETLYLVATSWPIKAEIDGLTLREAVKNGAKGLQTRIIKVVARPNAPESIPTKTPNVPKMDSLLVRVEGEGGWVRIVKFENE